jgi:uncharacterized protein involved in exopolysaccharide biosynthesis
MTITELVALIGGVGALIVSLFTLWQKARESARNTRVQEAASVLEGYQAFCDDLRERIAQLVEQIKGYEAQLADLREAQQTDREAFEAERTRLIAQHDRDRAVWERERADLVRQMAERESRIRELEQITARLRMTVDELVAKLAEYERREGGAT